MALAHEDPIDPLLEECLRAPMADQAAILDRLAAAHAEHGSELRARYRQLQEAGLLESKHDHASVDPGRDGSFGEFRILHELGRGGMGVVYLAEQPSMGRRVALKLLRPDVLGSARIRERFRREVEAASGLDHGGISTVFEAGEVDGTPYIAMRYVPGETLRARLRRTAGESNGSATQSELSSTLQLVERVARALHYAHERGFIHRDVKPGNVIVGDDDEPVLLDFGLARPEESTGDSLTMTGDALGTPAYMSPEQISPKGPVDRRADVYSLGATLFECLTGHTPFEAPTREELYRLILSTGRADASRHTRLLPRDLQVVLQTALARDRNQRYQTALDFAEDLRRVRERRPIAARRPSAVERAWSWARREPFKAALAVAVPLLCLVTGYVWASRDEIDAGAETIRLRQLDAALATGFAELQVGAARTAEAAFREARLLAPDDREAMAGLAMLLRVQRKDAAAERIEAELGSESFEAKCVAVWVAVMTKGMTRDGAGLRSIGEPDSATGYFLRGEVTRQLFGSFEWRQQSQRDYLRAIASSKRARLQYHLGLVWASGSLQDEKWIRTGVRALAEHWPEQRLSTVESALALAHVDRAAARRACDRLAQWPEDTHAVCIRGKVLLGLGEFEAAASALDPVLPKAWFEPHLWCARAFWQSGRTDEACRVLRRAIERWPNRPLAHARLASYEKNDRAAAAAYREHVERNPEDGRGHAGLAQALDRLKDPKALEHARRATQLDSQNSAAWRILSRILMRRGERDEARRIALRTIESRPHEPLNFLNAGHLALQVRDYANAARFYERANSIRLEPLSLYNQGLAEQRLGHVARAADLYRRHIRHQPRHPQAHINLAHALTVMRDVEAALPFMEKGEELGKGRPGWKGFGNRIAQLRQLVAKRAAQKRPDYEQDPRDLRQIVEYANSAYWAGVDARCVELFRMAMGSGVRWEPKTRYAFRWAAHAAVASMESEVRREARKWLTMLLNTFDKHAEAEPGAQLRLVIHQELYSWLTHPRFAPVREAERLNRLSAAERRSWQSFWERVRELSKTFDPVATLERR